MTSAIKDQLTLDNSNNESKMVVNNAELRDKILAQLEQFEIMFASGKIKQASAAMKEAKELVNQIN